MDPRLSVSGGKNKFKIELNKTFKTICNAVKPTSQLKQMLEPSMKDVFLDRTDKINQTILDPKVNKEFIKSEFNKAPLSDSYRSPYTHKFYPPFEDAPTFVLRQMQGKGKVLFDQYVRLYYDTDNIVNNFYVQESEEGINLVLLVKKIWPQGIWFTTSIMQIKGEPLKGFTYKLQSSMVYELDYEGGISLHGSAKKYKTQLKKLNENQQIDEFHLIWTGTFIEQNQNALRKNIEQVLALKTKDIIFNTRYQFGRDTQEQKRMIMKEIMLARAAINKKIIQE